MMHNIVARICISHAEQDAGVCFYFFFVKNAKTKTFLNVDVVTIFLLEISILAVFND